MPNYRRQSLIDKAFLKFDKDGMGYIEVKDLKGIYNTEVHPLVQRLVISKEEAFIELLENFRDWKSGKIYRDEWNDYYAAVSFVIDDDDHFVQLIKTAWRLD